MWPVTRKSEQNWRMRVFFLKVWTHSDSQVSISMTSHFHRYYGPFRNEWIQLSLWLHWSPSCRGCSRNCMLGVWLEPAKPKTKPNPLVPKRPLNPIIPRERNSAIGPSWVIQSWDNVCFEMLSVYISIQKCFHELGKEKCSYIHILGSCRFIVIKSEKLPVCSTPKWIHIPLSLKNASCYILSCLSLVSSMSFAISRATGFSCQPTDLQTDWKKKVQLTSYVLSETVQPQCSLEGMSGVI